MCKHEFVRIIEVGSAQTTHDRERDGEWSHSSDFGYYTGIVLVDCWDCGLKGKYGKRRPKWLVERLQEFLDTK